MIEQYTKPEYLDAVNHYMVDSGSNFWDTMSNLAFLGCLVDDWEKQLDKYLSDWLGVRFKIEEESQVRRLASSQEYQEQSASGTRCVITARDTHRTAMSSLAMMNNYDEIAFVLPYLRNDFKPSARLVTDLILTDAKKQGATDVRIDTQARYDGSFFYSVKFRLGIHLKTQTKYKIDKLLVDDIISDMLSNRSSVGHKLAELSINPTIKFRLIDNRFPARCQTGKSIGGPTIVFRMFDFKKAPDIDNLGFDKDTTNMLHYTSELSTGLTLVSGVFGSGKGTTLNAVGKKMESNDALAIASLDDPIEYLREYPQYEYSNHMQLESIIDGFKKMDLNVVYLNEVITPEVADGVFNLVSSGVHVLTTIHSNRVYRVLYKLNELLGDKYLSLLQYINNLSYQDKFSICCEKCSRGIHKDLYEENSNERKLLDFLKLDTIIQSEGCNECNYKGILPSGIKVVSEHITFNHEVKSDILKLNIHEQVLYLKEYLDRNNSSLEIKIKKELQNGKIKIDEVLQKLDTWR